MAGRTAARKAATRSATAARILAASGRGLPRRVPRALTAARATCPLRDHLPLMLRHGCQDVHGELVGVGHVHRHEGDPAFH